MKWNSWKLHQFISSKKSLTFIVNSSTHCCIFVRRKMYSSSKTKTSLFIVLLALVTLIRRSNSECCYPGWVAYECEDYFGICREQMCRDGTRAYGFCGVGSCNAFGCDCDGGCRTNNLGGDWDEAERLFARYYGKEIVTIQWSSRPRFRK